MTRRETTWGLTREPRPTGKTQSGARVYGNKLTKAPAAAPLTKAEREQQEADRKNRIRLPYVAFLDPAKQRVKG